MNPSQIIDTMMSKDRFSQWLNLQRIDEGEGYCILSMQVRSEMCNGFGIAHGGILHSFADSALAFASNSRGRISVSIESSIAHLGAVKEGEVLTATSEELHAGKSTASYIVRINNEKKQLVALFKGTVFRKDSDWEEINK